LHSHRLPPLMRVSYFVAQKAASGVPFSSFRA
jgi:hypothetical protein